MKPKAKKESPLIEDDSLEVNPEDLIIADTSSTPPETVPEMVEFKTNVFYDENLLEAFEGKHERAEWFVRIVFEIVRFRLRHDSLAMKVSVIHFRVCV